MYNKNERIGVAEVNRLVVKDLGWIFREQTTDDFGIDAHIEIQSRDYALGRLIALQIKSGPSYFKEISDSDVVFRGDKRHLNYWLEYSLPVVIVLYNTETEECIWEHITESKAEITGENWKIAVPRENTFDKNNAEFPLFKIANNMKRSVESILEDCVFDGDNEEEAVQIRHNAHLEVRQLNVSEKTTLSKDLQKRICDMIVNENEFGYSNNTVLSEYVYTLGVIGCKYENNEKFLIENVIEKSIFAEPIAHALHSLTANYSDLKETDTSRIDSWIERFQKTVFIDDPKNPDPDKRLFSYAEHLQKLIRARTKKFT